MKVLLDQQTETPCRLSFLPQNCWLLLAYYDMWYIYEKAVLLNISRLRLCYVSVDALFVRSCIRIRAKKNLFSFEFFLFYILYHLIETWLTLRELSTPLCKMNMTRATGWRACICFQCLVYCCPFTKIIFRHIAYFYKSSAFFYLHC